MGVVVEYPNIVHVDNFGEILLSNNTLVYQNMKYIERCHHLIWDYDEDGTAKIEFVHSEENLSDLFIKNLSNGPLESLTSRYIHYD